MLWGPLESSCGRTAHVEAQSKLPGSAEEPPATVPTPKVGRGAGQMPGQTPSRGSVRAWGGRQATAEQSLSQGLVSREPCL